MLFRLLGQLTSRYSTLVVGLWIAFLVASVMLAPKWLSVVENGEFAFLPADSPSVQASELFREAFPDHSASSNIVLVLRRETSAEEGLLPDDHLFIETVLVPMLRRVAGFTELDDEPTEDSAADQSLVRKISWRGTENIGPLYDSVDHKASLIVLELRTEFMDEANRTLIDSIEAELERLRLVPVPRPASKSSSTQQENSSGTVAETEAANANDNSSGKLRAIPVGLDVAFSGTAIYGRDAMMESQKSARATEKWTVLLVIILLLIMYRAPLLSMIPLVTVSVSGTISLSLLAIAAKLGWVHLFNGIEAYVTVLVYGAGIDYCLFMIARYREELLSGATIEEAISRTMENVGSALAASAGTTMCGIGMMYFAEFGKFQQAGIAISFGLFVCLCASLTLTPAIIRLSGRWAFWPKIPATQSATGATWVARPDFFSRLINLPILKTGWSRMANLLVRKPWTMWLGSILGMLPFSVIGFLCFGYLSYGLLSDLPQDAPSVRGAKALQTHFPGGEGVPVRALISVPDKDYTRMTPRPPADITALTNAILEKKDELGIHSVRSLADPKGGRDIGKVILAAERLRATQLFGSRQNPNVTRLDIIFKNDPFSKTSIDEFRTMRTALPKMLPESMKGATISFAGETANLSDLKEVTDRDRIRVNMLVTVVVFVILWLLLRQPGICAYLIVTVLFSYFATLGCTYLFFWASDPAGFAGLDWKVPMFLFTILIAVGEDYNIFLLARIEEEKKQHGPVGSITVALNHTGSIISSCGIIMAGTFSSLMAGSLAGMDQLGFALALGVVLDTFVVRPIMVPAFLILLAEGRFRIGARSAVEVADSDSAD